MCVLPFTLEFSRLSPDEFVHAVLVERLHAAAVVVGENFRYGHKAAGDVAALTAAGRRFGFSVEGVAAAGQRRHHLVLDVRALAASTPATSRAPRRRSAASTAIEGVVVRGDQRGRELGYPTANLEPLPWSAVPGRRRLRRPAGARGGEHAAGGHQHRHQPDLRRPRAPGRGVRPGRRAGSTSTASTSACPSPPGCAARSASTTSRRCCAQMADDVARTREVLGAHPSG